MSIGSQILGLFFSFTLYYFLYILFLIPLYSEVKKFRLKKMEKSIKKLNNIKTSLYKTTSLLQTFLKKKLIN